MFAAASSAAEEGAAFLRLGQGARAQGLGGAYTALAEDASAVHWNPAALAGLGKKELGFTHAELVSGTRYEALAFAQPMSRGTLAAGAAYLGQGTVEGRDSAGRPSAGFTASDMAVGVSYGAGIRPGTRLGGSAKYVQSRLAEAEARTFALDLGASQELNIRGPGAPRLGIAVQNLGPGLKYADETVSLPLAVSAGGSYRLPAGLVLSLDVRHRPHSSRSEVAAGTEYAILPAFALRAGYGSGRSAGAQEGAARALGGLSAGFGVRASAYTLDYAISPFGELGQVQRFSLGARW